MVLSVSFQWRYPNTGNLIVSQQLVQIHNKAIIKAPGPLFTKREDVLPFDLMKSRSRMIRI